MTNTSTQRREGAEKQRMRGKPGLGDLGMVDGYGDR